MAKRRRAGTEEDKAVRRAEILRAAKEVFARNGVHGTTIADVARAAGGSYGIVYWYFDSKESLFDAVMEAEGDALQASVLDELSRDGPTDPDEALVRTMRAVFAHFGRDHAAARLLVRDSPHAPFAGRFLTELAAIVADGQQHGRLREGQPEVIAFVFASLVGQLVVRRLRTDDGMSDDQAAEFVVAALLDGFRAR